jgi:hypothetical protein
MLPIFLSLAGNNVKKEWPEKEGSGHLKSCNQWHVLGVSRFGFDGL